MRRLDCAEVWGGVAQDDVDVCTRDVVISLHASAAGGPRGGDVHYLSLCGDEELTRVAVLDMAGHGEAVARVGEWLCDALRRRIGDPDGSAILAELNRRLYRRGARAMTTGVIAGFERSGSILHHANAGHPPLLLRRAGEESWIRQHPAAPEGGPANPALGVLPDALYGETKLPLARGDRLLIHSDGVTDALGPGGARFGEAGLEAFLERSAHLDVTALRRELVAELRRFTGGRLDHDDVTIVALAVR